VTGPGDPGRRAWWGLCLAVAAVAFAARLVPVLRSGGLYGVEQYDAAVYFGSAVALVHGRLPYADFLLLHPPGVVVALAPFGALARLMGDSDAMAVARLAWMGLGAASAVLVARILRPRGLVAAALGGLAYAVSYPAVAIEQTTRLEAPAATCLLGAVALLSVAAPRTGLRPGAVALAGALLGFAATVKIWGVVPLGVVAIYLLAVAGWRRLAWFVAGAGATGVAVCLPFLLAAPEVMWRQVVTDQLGRLGSRRSTLTRLADMTGLGLVDNRLDEWAPAVVGTAVGLLALGAVLAVRVVQARPAIVLLVACVALLLATPTWFPHYAGLMAGVTAVVFGAALDLVRRAAAHRLWRGLVAAAGGLVLVGWGAQLSAASFAKPFPVREMTAAVAPLPGCITADDPSILIAMDVLGRNLRRGCPLVLDPGGYSYEFRPPIVRERDPRWQRFFLDYLASGTATMKVRYSTNFGLARATAREYRRWPLLYAAGDYELKRPPR